MSLVDVARIVLGLDLPLKTLPELETSSEIANASLEATQNKESTRPSERVRNHMMELQEYGIFRNLYIVTSVPLLC